MVSKMCFVKKKNYELSYILVCVIQIMEFSYFFLIFIITRQHFLIKDRSSSMKRSMFFNNHFLGLQNKNNIHIYNNYIITLLTRASLFLSFHEKKPLFNLFIIMIMFTILLSYLKTDT